MSSNYPATSASQYVLAALISSDKPFSSAQNIKLTPIYLLGWFLIMFSAVLRLSSYRTLGRYFTFELGIQKGHKLVTTGPYAYVRHPSYIGLPCASLGHALCHLTPGSWVWECTELTEGTLGMVLGLLWVVVSAASLSAFLVRIKKEDEMLRKEFGKEWEEWAKRVRWKVIPWLF